MTPTYGYLIHPRTGTIHVGHGGERTLCGLDAELFDVGDETLSGIALTCEHCRGIIQLKGRK
jgi:hypothetical protein